MEDYVLDTFHAFHRVTSQDLKRHHDCILHDFCIVFKVEDMNGSVVGTGSHKWVLFVETDASDCLLVELHCFVWFC